MQTQPDLQTFVSFLIKRVKSPDEDDCGKLKRGLKYLKGTQHMKLVLTLDSLNIIRWWVDVSHNVYWNYKEHTGMMILLGTGAAMMMSFAQKTTTGSSTKSELVSIDDVLTKMFWGKYFIEA